MTEPEFEVDQQTIDDYGEWTECRAFRFVRDGDEVRLQISHKPKCGSCRGRGTVGSSRVACPKCKGSGRAA